MKTTLWPKRGEIEKKWLVINADGQTVGRLSSEVAKLIRGKHKPYYTPNMDCGDHVIITNAEKIKFTGNKLFQKEYFRHSNYPGGLKVTSAEDMLKKHPERILEKAVKGMLPKNRLGRKLYTRLHVCVGEQHHFEAQQPESFQI